MVWHSAVDTANLSANMARVFWLRMRCDVGLSSRYDLTFNGIMSHLLGTLRCAEHPRMTDEAIDERGEKTQTLEPAA